MKHPASPLLGRWCSTCQTMKPDWAFYANCFDCKECRKARVNAYHERNKEKVRETNRINWEALKADPVAYEAYQAKKAARRKSPKGREKLREYMRNYQRNRRANAAGAKADRGSMVDCPDGRQH